MLAGAAGPPFQAKTLSVVACVRFVEADAIPTTLTTVIRAASVNTRIKRVLIGEPPVLGGLVSATPRRERCRSWLRVRPIPLAAPRRGTGSEPMRVALRTRRRSRY